MHFKKQLIIFSPKEAHTLIDTFERLSTITKSVEESTRHFYPEMYPIIDKLKTTRALTPSEFKTYQMWRQHKGTACNTDYGKLLEAYYKKTRCTACKGLGYIETPPPTHACKSCDSTGWNLKIKDLISIQTPKP